MDTLFKKALKAFAGSAVLEDIENNGEKSLVPHNEKQYLTIMFHDISSFTNTVEGLESEQILDSLNAYLKVSTEIIHKHEGTIVQFSGNAVFSVFGYRGKPNHEANACLAALDIVNNINSHKALTPLANDIKMKVGINTGSAYIGTFGTADKLQFMVIGDHVNFASRLSDANTRYHSTILLSDTTRKKLPKEFLLEKKGTVTVKGKIDNIDIYSLEGIASGE